MKLIIFLQLILVGLLQYMPTIWSQISKTEAVIAESLLTHLKYFRLSIAHPAAVVPSQWTLDAVRIISKRGVAINFLPVKELYNNLTHYSKHVLTDNTAILTREESFWECFDNRMEPIRLRILEDQYRWINRNNYGWLVIMNNKNSFLPNSLFVPFGVQVFLIQPKTTEDYLIWEQYHAKNDSRKRPFATWRSHTGLSVVDSRPLYGRRSMNGVTLKRLVVYDVYRSYSDIIRMNRDVLDSFSMIFNFTIENMEEEVGLSINSDYDVMDQLVLYHYVTPFRVKNIGPTVKFTVNLYYQYLNENSEENYIFRPFTGELWQVLALWIAMAAVCSATVRYSTKRTKMPPTLRIFSVIDAFCNQDSDEESKGLTERLTCIFIWTMVFFVIPAYSSIIYSFMTIRKPYVPFEDLRGFIKDGSYKYGGTPGTLLVKLHMIENQDTPIAEATAKFMVNASDMPKSMAEGIQRICRDKHFAFLSFGNSLQKHATPCRITKMKIPYFTGLYSSMTQKGFPFSSALKEKLPLLHSAGILSIMKIRLDELLDDNEQIDAALPVTTELTRSVLLLVPVSVALSLIILLTEALCAYHQQVMQFIKYYAKIIWISIKENTSRTIDA